MHYLWIFCFDGKDPIVVDQQVSGDSVSKIDGSGMQTVQSFAEVMQVSAKSVCAFFGIACLVIQGDDGSTSDCDVSNESEGAAMFMIEYRDLGWWYWLVTACLLTGGVAGNPAGFMLAIGLTVFQLIHYVIRENSITAFPVQVRFWYLILLLVAFQEPLRLIYWIPTIGTWAQIIFGYCTMARCVSLLPWNRNEPFSLGLLKKTFFSRPVRGSIQQGFAASTKAAS